MVAIKNLFLFAAAAAATVLPRDAAQVLKDLQNIDSKTNALTSAIQKWDGTLFGATGINSAESALESAIKSATTDAQNSNTASSTDAQNIINYINNTLEPDVRKSTSALVARKADFQKAGLTNTVKSDLNNLKSETDTLSSALIAKTPSAQQSAAKSAQAKIDADFQSAINSFA